jgi:hypothetical protein
LSRCEHSLTAHFVGPFDCDNVASLTSISNRYRYQELREMAPPLIISLVVGLAISAGAAWYWRMGDTKSAKKLLNAAIACWILVLMFLGVALISSDPSIWWGSGCNLGMASRGLCHSVTK